MIDDWILSPRAAEKLQRATPELRLEFYQVLQLLLVDPLPDSVTKFRLHFGGHIGFWSASFLLAYSLEDDGTVLRVIDLRLR